MLADTPAFASFSIDDIEAAKKFYSQTLGLEVEEKYGGLQLHTKGNQPLMVYPKDDHEPATYTVLNFMVDDIEKAVDELAAKGVEFEQYTGEIQTDEKGIHQWENGPKMAWFKDPAGNIFALIQEK